MKLDSLIRNNDNEKRILEIDNFLFSMYKPSVFSGEKSAEIKYEKDFQNMCLFLKHQISVDPKTMSVVEFYNSFNYIKKLNKKNGK